MAGLWSVLIPETADVTNLVTNPSGETATTGYAARSGGTLAGSTSKSRRGYKSLSYTSTTATTDGIYYDAVAVTSGTTYTLAFDFWGANAIPFTAFFATTAGTAVDDAITWTASAQWERKVVTHSASASTNFRLYIAKNNSDDISPFYTDGVGVYALDHDPGHIDGDQADCYWTGTAHASTSVRTANSRGAGQTVNFDTYGFYLSDWPGAGMAEVDPLTSQRALLPGSQDDGERIPERPFSLVGEIIGTSLADLHAKRRQVIDALKADRVKNSQQPVLVYSGANSVRPVRIRAKYTGGLTMGETRGYSERVALKFLATDPFWNEDGVEGAALITTLSDSDTSYAAKRVAGTWSGVNSAFNGAVNAVLKGADGGIYYGGAFTDLGSAAGDRIVKFSTASATAPSAVGTGAADNSVLALALAPNGDVYAGGSFTAMGGVANTARIARWDGANWNALSTGISAGTVQALVPTTNPDSDGTGAVYVAGNFTNLGDASGDYISRWTGSAWASLGTGMDGIVYALTASPSGTLYAGGVFTTAGGVSSPGVALWSDSAWSAMSTGVSGGTATVYALAMDKAGNVYLGGNFTAAGGVSCSNIAKWNGKSFEPLGTGASDSVYALAVDDSGMLWVGGAFTAAGGISAGGLALWNGYTWAHAPANPGGSILAICLDGDNVYLGTSAAGTGTYSSLNTVTNSGTASAFPKFAFTGAATVQWIRNDTTGKTLHLNYLLQTGETLYVDCSLGARAVTSSRYGNVIGRALLRNSDFAEFALLPGSNSLSVYASASITGSATWNIAHWSNDGSST